ncbi:MAG: taurine dioxygenase [Rhodospirillaceae bacterium]|nr:taurine dioxygenase [Rhodospirillaceae bacterium]
MKISRFKAAFGAEVTELDCSRIIDEETLCMLKEAFLEYSLLVFRNQNLTPDQQVLFSKNWGRLQRHILVQYLLPDCPEILVVSNKKDEEGNPVGISDAGRYWHTDISYNPDPPLGSLLYGIEVPKIGGDTMFASQYLAYRNLPSDIKSEIAGLQAYHYFNYSKLQKHESSERKPLSKDQINSLKGAVHPVVRIHPETKQPALYVNPGFTQKLERTSVACRPHLLNLLFDYATSESVIYRHKWEPRDLVFWDNRCLMHHATDYSSKDIRHMHRTTVLSQPK